ncbi:RNA polymerase I-specific transcription initiation factor RRN5 [Wickerhamomyces ciferrii]|uniref:RNA polymerase I-specific transcription initiation factor RRN5 n=1 Tax=Wickerhamomyces ciferrii (strain ATCC 14091 / BCRC 22168 / CBS 111 / JCM 3599 / NBRC 0793 / NRRL Y-1031 F-60-10) TaxID=1206466 RepID=K0KJP6_WICCF|nr:RNA polymerase I-specific transcription initiation factor RRN5 [Wickerhamomyces ciferrii]CCH41699.1 RNA polymerase I-specific transcription initiation factor RRN5 [Wickerhamomyces ciferrii]
MTVKRKISLDNGLENIKQEQSKRQKVDGDDDDDFQFDKDQAYNSILEKIKKRELGYKITKKSFNIYYEDFIKRESKPFEAKFQSKDSFLKSSYISKQGSFQGLKPRSERTKLGTLWSSFEKEVFFEYLSRYGPKQPEKIKERLPNKSIIEVEIYIDLLQRNLNYYKSHKSRFFNLIKYEDIPIAWEIDELTISIEEQNVLNNEVYTSQTQFDKLRDQESLKLTLSTNDENELINTSQLNSIASFYHMNHLYEYPLSSNDEEIEPNLGDSYQLIKTIITNMTKLLIKTIIQDKIYQNSKKIEISTQGDELIIPVNLTDIIQAFQLNFPKRVVGLREYMKNLHNRLEFDIEVEYSKQKKFQDVIPIPKTFESFRINHELDITEEEEEELLLDVPEGEEEDGDGFIIDSMEDLDNKLALKLFYKSDYEINLQDLERSKFENEKLLYEWDSQKSIEIFNKNFDHWLEKEFNSQKFETRIKRPKVKPNLNSMIIKKQEYFKNLVEFEDPDIDEIFNQIDEELEPSEQEEPQDDEITKEMLILYNLSFD